MARYFKTPERQFTDDYLYKPPVELLKQVITDRTNRLDKAQEEANAANLAVLQNLNYHEIDRPIADALRQTLDNNIRNLTQRLYTDPNNPELQREIQNYKNDVALMLTQGGDIYNLKENKKRLEEAQAEVAKTFKNNPQLARNISNDILGSYRNLRINEDGSLTPLSEGNMFDINTYKEGLEFTDAKDPVMAFYEFVSKKKPRETGTTFVADGKTYHKKTSTLSQQDIENLYQDFLTTIDAGGLGDTATLLKWYNRVGTDADSSNKGGIIDQDGKINRNNEYIKSIPNLAKKIFEVKNSDLTSTGGSSSSKKEDGSSNNSPSYITLGHIIKNRTYVDRTVRAIKAKYGEEKANKILESLGYNKDSKIFENSQNYINILSRNPGLESIILDANKVHPVKTQDSKSWKNMIKTGSAGILQFGDRFASNGYQISYDQLQGMKEENLVSTKDNSPAVKQIKATIKEKFKFDQEDASSWKIKDVQLGNQAYTDEEESVLTAPVTIVVYKPKTETSSEKKKEISCYLTLDNNITQYTDK